MPLWSPKANRAVTWEGGREALCAPWDPSYCFRRARGMLDPAESGSTTRAAWQSRECGPSPVVPHAGAVPVPWQSWGGLAASLCALEAV